MEIIIHQAILHVLDTTMDAPVLSGSGMEMTAEKTAYFQYHIEKLLASAARCRIPPLKTSWSTTTILWTSPAASRAFCSTTCTRTPPFRGQTLPWWILPAMVSRGWAS